MPGTTKSVPVKALETIRAGAIRRLEGARVYMAKSASDPEREYFVVLSDQGPAHCTCEAGSYGQVCRHLAAAAVLEQQERAKAERDRYNGDGFPREGQLVRVRDDLPRGGEEGPIVRADRFGQEGCETDYLYVLLDGAEVEFVASELEPPR